MVFLIGFYIGTFSSQGSPHFVENCTSVSAFRWGGCQHVTITRNFLPQQFIRENCGKSIPNLRYRSSHKKGPKYDMYEQKGNTAWKEKDDAKYQRTIDDLLPPFSKMIALWAPTLLSGPHSTCFCHVPLEHGRPQVDWVNLEMDECSSPCMVTSYDLWNKNN